MVMLFCVNLDLQINQTAIAHMGTTGTELIKKVTSVWDNKIVFFFALTDAC